MRVGAALSDIICWGFFSGQTVKALRSRLPPLSLSLPAVLGLGAGVCRVPGSAEVGVSHRREQALPARPGPEQAEASSGERGATPTSTGKGTSQMGLNLTGAQGKHPSFRIEGGGWEWR